MTPEEIYRDHLDFLSQVIRSTCRYHHLRQEDAEEFESLALAKLWENDCAIIRKFEGRCQIKTYFRTVIGNLLKDFMNHLWGKWRPCEEAKRLGPVAVKLDFLLNREGYTFDEACEILRTNHRVEMSVQELDKLATRIPRRSSRQIEGDESLLNLPAQDGSADSRILEQEKAAQKRKIFEALKQSLATLPDEDRLIAVLRGRFGVGEIARIQKLEAKPLYRRCERILKTLRHEMEQRGIHGEDLPDF